MNFQQSVMLHHINQRFLQTTKKNQLIWCVTSPNNELYVFVSVKRSCAMLLEKKLSSTSADKQQFHFWANLNMLHAYRKQNHYQVNNSMFFEIWLIVLINVSMIFEELFMYTVAVLLWATPVLLMK